MFDFSGGAGALLLLMVLLPAVFGLLLRALKGSQLLRTVMTVAAALVNAYFALSLYMGGGFSAVLPYAPAGFALTFRVDSFSALFILFTAAVFVLIAVYTAFLLKGADYGGTYLFLLFLSLGFINGAMLSDNLGIMLFFWEGLLCTLFGMLLLKNRDNPKTAVKALTISGFADLLLMLGIIITAVSAGTADMSRMGRLPIQGVSAVGFVCMMLGAVGKGGAMPFHSWIPDAAQDAPTAFMVAFPAALEKILGIYLAARTVLVVYDFQPGGGASLLIMAVGAVTIVLAVGMALIQKDIKKLLAYHAVSQVGYMVLGIGTGLTVGIIGGLFHMVNNVLYKSGLFMVAGGIEKRTGTTDLKQLGGLGRSMPVTAVCFIIFALSISGFPGFNGFFSKELIFDAAAESGMVFYICAVLGAFMTALSFLKLGRALFFGKEKLPKGINKVGELSAGLLVPMCVLAVSCVVFGLYNALPLDRFLCPAVAGSAVAGSAVSAAEKFSGWPHSAVLVAVSLTILALAVLDHAYGSRKSGSALGAADHIHNAPVLHSVYARAEKGSFDPYGWLLALVGGFSRACSGIERAVSWVYDTALPGVVERSGFLLHRLYDGRLSRYLSLAVLGLVAVAAVFLIMLI